jgi:hypothetical protein
MKQLICHNGIAYRLYLITKLRKENIPNEKTDSYVFIESDVCHRG